MNAIKYPLPLYKKLVSSGSYEVNSLHHKVRGFSLLELLTVLAVLGILFSTSHLSIKGLKSAHLKSEAAELVQYIETLSIIAAKYNSDIEIVFTKNQAIAQARECPNCPPFSPQVLGNGISFSDVKFGNFSDSPNKLILWKSGSSTPGHIKLQNLKESQCLLTISQTSSKTLSCEG